MSELLDVAISNVRALPEERQDEVARIVMRLVGVDGELYALSDDESLDLDQADAEIARGEMASDGDVATLWSRTIIAP